MRAGWRLLMLVAMSAISSISSASPQSAAFAQGSSMGNGAVQGMFSGINSSAAQSNIPGYGGSVSTQSGYFAGGNGNIEAPGTAQITNCANATPGSNQMANQYCNAVNFLATNPTIRPQITISPNDSMLVNSRTISNNPSSILQANGISTSGTSSQCVPVTTTTPAQYTTEMCSTVQGMNLAQCVLGRVVNISTDTNYQCNQTINAYQTQTCNRTVVVTVIPGQTVAATQSTAYQITEILFEDGNQLPVGTVIASPASAGLYPFPTMASLCSPFFGGGGGTSYTNWNGGDGYCIVAITSSSCPSGYTLSGSYCVGPATVTTTWNDGCATLEAAAQ